MHERLGSFTSTFRSYWFGFGDGSAWIQIYPGHVKENLNT